MSKSKWDTFEFIDYLNVDTKEIKDLPEGVSISTMCASCKLNSNLNIPNIERYLQLNSDDVLTVKMSKERIRSLIVIKNKPTRIKKNDTKINQKDTSKNHFYNQITVVMRINHGIIKDINEVPKINMKLFKNGSVQMSGCKSIKNINFALNKLISKLKEIKGKIENGIISEKTFIEDSESITVKDFKIDMINSNYRVAMQIDRDKLFKLLLKKKIKSSYEPCIRACVIIKYIPLNENIEQKEVSVFVFQKGNIIITGARSKSHIDSTYNYINNVLLSHKDEIIKKDEKEEEDTILGIYESILKDINIGLINVDS
jgi:TATA-box binding protein (TBP) (component of TFIID and TFIIIB)